MIKARYKDILPIENIDSGEVTDQHIEAYLLKHHITSYKELSGGRLNRVLLADDRVIKFSRGSYRATELEREAHILFELRTLGSRIVPSIDEFVIEDEYSVIIESFVEGDSLRQLLKSNVDKSELWKSAGELLSKVHIYEVKDHDWLEGQLELASYNYKNNLIDLDDFDNENPKDILSWLENNQPDSFKMTLLHGDFRTKNIIASEEGLKLIDWGFVDIGSPYYDLAIMDYYFANDEERQSFYAGYERLTYDKDLIAYYEKLSRYINI